jgi:hypothetical protein
MRPSSHISERRSRHKRQPPPELRSTKLNLMP